MVIGENKEIPSVSFTIDASVITGLQNKIIMTGFFVLGENVSSESCDGSNNHITVYTKINTHHSGGLNPSNLQFCIVEDAIWDAVPDDVMEEYSLAVELYHAD